MNQRVACVLMAAALLLPPRVAAQMRRPGFAGVPPHSVTLTFGSQPQLPNSFSQRTIFLGEPIFYPDYYSSQPVAPPQVVVVQVPASSPENKALENREAPRSVHPLLIEWQDNRFVRVTATEQSPSNGRSMSPDHATETIARSNSPAQAGELLPALLIFRDGHREEAANYAIVGGVLYTYPDYWTGGAWAKKILISDLNLPATFQQNQQRGVKFVLPTGPNQVVTRP